MIPSAMRGGTMYSQPAARVLVTGIAGFIGFHLARALAARGIAVDGVDNVNGYYDLALKRARLQRLEGVAAFTQLDLTDAEGFRRHMAAYRPDAVIHLAAQAGVRYSLDRPDEYVSANLAGFLSVLEACRHVGTAHLVYASSSSVYGLNAKAPFSEHDGADHPLSLYAATKRANELMAHSYSHLFAIPATALRFFTVYGPWGRPDMAYFKFTKAVFEGRPIDVYNHGAMRRDFTYIDDVVEAIVALIDKPPTEDAGFDAARPDPAGSPAPHRILNIGNEQPVELSRFIDLIGEAAGREVERRLLPMQPGDVPMTYADTRELARLVGFAPRTSIEEGIGRFVAWYREFYEVR